MKVSIIMCAYNSAQYIERAIQSIIDQTYTNWELIISDDASPGDNTVEIAQRYADKDPRVKVIVQPENLGYLGNKNDALKRATGELVTQLDADDTSKPERLEKQVAPFLNDPKLMICGTNYEIIDEQDNVLECKEYEQDFVIAELQREYPFWFPGLMWRKELFNEVGYFSDYFDDVYGDDHYWTYVVNSKYPIYFVKDALYGYRSNPNSLTNVFDSPRKMFANELLGELYRQIKETGTDWLQKNQRRKLRDFEMSLFQDNALMAEKYRIWAAKAIDRKDWATAKKLILKKLKYKKNSIDGFRTILYYYRRKYLNS
ncbi:MAG: glycosyltransferase family 2 protein [Flavipsychrobacter sp.]